MLAFFYNNYTRFVSKARLFLPFNSFGSLIICWNNWFSVELVKPLWRGLAGRINLALQICNVPLHSDLLTSHEKGLGLVTLRTMIKFSLAGQKEEVQSRF